MDLYFGSFFVLLIILALALLVVTFNYTLKFLSWFNRHPTAFGFLSLSFGGFILYLLFNWQFFQIRSIEATNLPSVLFSEMVGNYSNIESYCQAMKSYDSSIDEQGTALPIWVGYKDNILQQNKELIMKLNPENAGLLLQTAKQMEPFKPSRSDKFEEKQVQFLCNAMVGRHKFLLKKFRK